MQGLPVLKPFTFARLGCSIFTRAGMLTDKGLYSPQYLNNDMDGRKKSYFIVHQYFCKCPLLCLIMTSASLQGEGWSFT